MLSDWTSAVANCSIECCEENSNDCEGKACNPFQACGSCVLECPKLLSNEFRLIQSFTDHGPGRIVSFLSEYNAEFWQPPKIV